MTRKFRITRRGALALAGASLLPLGAPAVRAQTPRVSGTVVFACYFGIVQDKYTEAVLNPFMERFPGVRVQYRPVRNSAEAIALLRLNRTRPTIDVAVLDITVALQAAREQLFAPLDPQLVPNLADIPAWGRPAGNQIAALSLDNIAIIYNGREVRTPPTSWNALADPALRGRLAMAIADTRGVVLLTILSRMGGTDYRTSIEPGIQKLKEIAPNVQTWDPQPDIYTAVRSGQVAMGIGWNGRGQYTHDISSGDVSVALPLEGSVGQVNTINLAATSTNAPAAQALINYCLSPEAQTRFAQTLFYGPTNSKAALAPELSARIFGGPEVAQRQLHLDWEWLSGRYGPWVQRIRREVISG